METLIRLLHDGGHSLVISNGTLHTFDGRGVSDLYRLLRHDPALLSGARVADKVVGKAAAALMVLGGIRELHADVISRPALELFAREGGVKVGYATEVPHIINRTQTDWCPLEKRCFGCLSARECYAQIEDFFETLPR